MRHPVEVLARHPRRGRFNRPRPAGGAENARESYDLQMPRADRPPVIISDHRLGSQRPPSACTVASGAAASTCGSGMGSVFVQAAARNTTAETPHPTPTMTARQRVLSLAARPFERRSLAGRISPPIGNGRRQRVDEGDELPPLKLGEDGSEARHRRAEGRAATTFRDPPQQVVVRPTNRRQVRRRWIPRPLGAVALSPGAVAESAPHRERLSPRVDRSGARRERVRPARIRRRRVGTARVTGLTRDVLGVRQNPSRIGRRGIRRPRLRPRRRPGRPLGARHPNRRRKRGCDERGRDEAPSPVHPQECISARHHPARSPAEMGRV